jgi:hypothetical protein
MTQIFFFLPIKYTSKQINIAKQYNHSVTRVFKRLYKQRSSAKNKLLKSTKSSKKRKRIDNLFKGEQL